MSTSLRPLNIGNPHRAACWLVFGVLVAFGFCIGASMGAYPGGTHFDARSAGYDFWANFWCDALRNPAINGVPNGRGARLATIALWVLSSGLIPFWGVAASLSTPGRRGLGLAIQVLGVTAMLGMMGVTLLPSNEYPMLHGWLVLIAGPPGIAATALCIVAGATSPRVPRSVTWLGAAALVLALSNFVQYARQFWLGVPGWALLPAVQKVATALFLGWVAALCAIAFTRRWR
ncbi:MAG: hypothetical protein ACOY0T_14435 [Myxococcota bacterium]